MYDKVFVITLVASTATAVLVTYGTSKVLYGRIKPKH